jgi:hypothetical protein
VLRMKGAHGQAAPSTGLFRPQDALRMLATVAGEPLRLLHMHRLCVETNDDPLTEEEAAAAAQSADDLAAGVARKWMDAQALAR